MRHVMVIILCAALAALPVGCASTGSNTQTGAITGGAIGAGMGGLIGGLAGHSAGSAAIGAAIGLAVGALAGAAIGNYYDRQERDAIQTARYYNYRPAQGTMVRVENVRVEPELIEPGRPSKLVMNYALLDPNTGRPVAVTEKREIRSGSDELLKDIGPRVVERNPGTYSTEQEVTFPKDIPQGTYALKAGVEAAGRSDYREARFRVAKVSTPNGYKYAVRFLGLSAN
jgi:hypothetical protein